MMRALFRLRSLSRRRSPAYWAFRAARPPRWEWLKFILIVNRFFKQGGK